MIRAATTYWPPTEALLPVAIRAIYRPDGNWQTYQPEKLMRPGSTPGVGTSGALYKIKPINMPRPRSFTDDELLGVWDSCDSISQVVKELYDNNGGGCHKTVKRAAKNLGLDVEGKKNQNKCLGSGKRPDRRIPLEKILDGKKPKYATHRLKKRLFENSLKERKCECCGIEQWRGKEAPLELHHINGDSKDHRIENLQILCPNCHAQTENYKGKNK